MLFLNALLTISFAYHLCVNPTFPQPLDQVSKSAEQRSASVKSAKPTFVPLQVCQLLIHITQGLKANVFKIQG